MRKGKKRNKRGRFGFALSFILTLLWSAELLQAQAPTITGAGSISAVINNPNNGVLVSTLGTTTPADIGRIASSRNNASAGDWQYMLGGGATWNNLPASPAVVVLGFNDRLRFNATVTGSPTLQMHAWTATSLLGGTDYSMLSDAETAIATAGGTVSISTIQVTTSITSNNRPTVTGSAATITVAEDNSDPSGDAASNLGTVDDAESGMTIGRIITGFNNGDNGGDIGVWEYGSSGSWTPITTSIVSASSWLPLLASVEIRFLPNANMHTGAGTAPTLTLRAWDATQGTAGTATTSATLGSGATASYSSSSIILTATVTSVNDRPTVTGSAATITVAEDDSDPSGDAASNLGTVNDAESGITIGRIITGFNNGNNGGDIGVWEYGSSGSWTKITLTTLPSSNWLPLVASVEIRFLPNANMHTGSGIAPTLTLRAWDATQGTAGAATTSATLGSGATASYSSGSITLTATVTSENDRPTVNASGNTATIMTTEDNTSSSVDASNLGTVNDAESGSTIGRIITGFNNGDNGGDIGVWEYRISGGSWTTITTSIVSASSWLPLSSTDDIHFLPNANMHTGAGTAPTLTLRAWDENTGAAGTAAASATFGSGATASYSSGSITLTATVTSENDRPTVDASGNTAAITTEEDDTDPTGSATSTASSLGTVNDAESSSTIGRIITGFNNGNNGGAIGVWQYRIVGSGWIPITSTTLSGGSWLPLNGDNRLRFLPSLDQNTIGAITSPTLTLRAWDESIGTAGTAAASATLGSGATASYSSGSITLTATVEPVNDAPSFQLRTGSGEINGLHNSSPLIIVEVDDASDISQSFRVNRIVTNAGVDTEETGQNYEWSVSASVVSNSIDAPTGAGGAAIGAVFGTSPAIGAASGSSIDLTNLLSGAVDNDVKFDFVTKTNVSAMVEITITATDQGSAVFGTANESLSETFYIAIVDKVSPKIESFFPFRGATVLTTLSTIEFIFDEKIDKPTSGTASIRINGSSITNRSFLTSGSAVSVLSSPGNRVTLTIDPPIVMSKGAEVSITIDDNAFLDKGESAFTGVGAVSTTNNAFSSTSPAIGITLFSTDLDFWKITAANTSPMVTSSSPFDGASEVDLLPNIIFTFDENIQIALGSIEDIKIFAGTPRIETHVIPVGAESMDGSSSVSNNRLQITLKNPLTAATDIVVEIPSNVLQGATSMLQNAVSSIGFMTANVPIFQGSIAYPIHGATAVLPSTGEEILTASYSVEIKVGGSGSVRVLVRGNLIGGDYTEIYTLSAISASPVSDIADCADLCVLSGRPDELRITLPNFTGRADYRIVIEQGVVESIGPPSLASLPVEAGNWEFTTSLSYGLLIPGPLVNPSATEGIVSGKIEFSFSEPIIKRVGGFKLYIVTEGTGELFREIPISSSIVSVSGRTVTIDYDNSLTADPLDDLLPHSATFYLTMESGSFTSYSGEPVQAVFDPTQWRFATTDIGDIVGPRIVSIIVSSGDMKDVEYGAAQITAGKRNAPIRDFSIDMLFDEPLMLSSAPGKKINLYQGNSCSGSSIVTTITPSPSSIGISGQRVTVPISTELAYSATYTLVADEGVFWDASFNDAAQLCYTFETRRGGPDFNSDPALREATTVIEYAKSAPNGTDMPFVFAGGSGYSNLRWSQKLSGSTYRNIVSSPPHDPRMLTYAQLSTASQSTLIDFDFPLDTGDINVYTYVVWDEDPLNISDSTELTLVILEMQDILIEKKEASVTIEALTSPAILPSTSRFRFDASFVYNDNPASNTSLIWSDRFTYDIEIERPSDGESRAIFSPNSVGFPEGETTRRLNLTVTLTNTFTGESHTVPAFEITVSNDPPFSPRFTRTVNPPAGPGVPTSLNVETTLCQHSGAHDLSEYVEVPSPNFIPYTDDYLRGRFDDGGTTRFLRLSSSLQGFVQKPVSTITPGFDRIAEGYAEVLVDLTGSTLSIGDIPWRLNTDSVSSVNGKLEAQVNRLLEIQTGALRETVPAGRANVTIYQAPEIEFILGAGNFDKYCRNNDVPERIPVRVRILRGGRRSDGSSYPPTSGVSGENNLLGTFNVYVTTSTTTTMPPEPDYPNLPTSSEIASSVIFTSKYFYDLATASDPDSVFVRLEYVSDEREDLGENSACIGRAATEFIVYNNPAPPTFSYGRASVYNDPLTGHTEAVYCEELPLLDRKAFSIVNPRSDERYRWYDEIGFSTLTDDSQFLPPSDDFTTDVTGDDVVLYTYRVTRTRYASGFFLGCESSPEDVYMALVGRPEVSIDADGEVCIGAVEGTNGNFDYRSVQATITASNNRVIPGGMSSFAGYGVSSSSVLEATFDPLAAVKAFQRDKGGTSINEPKDFVGSSLPIEISYTWSNQRGTVSCSSTEIATIVVNGLPSVRFSAPTKGIDSDNNALAEVCVDEDAFQVGSSSIQNVRQFFYLDELLGGNSQSAGNFSVTFVPNDIRRRKAEADGITNHQFTESTVHRVTYISSNAEGCQNFVSKEVTIHSIPDMDFSPPEGCKASSIEFLVTIANEDNLELPDGTSGMRDYLWEYPDGSGISTTLIDEPDRMFSQVFPEAQVHNITLTATTLKGCAARLTKSVDVGIIPGPEVAWEGSTVNHPITFRIYESRLPIERIKEARFHIEDANGVLAGSSVVRNIGLKSDYLDDITYTFERSGLYDAVFEIGSEVNCNSSIRRKIKVLPVHGFVGGAAYSTDFESSGLDWYVDTLSVVIRDPNPNVDTERGKKKVLTVESRISSWQLGGVSGGEGSYITGAASGSRAWFTKRPESEGNAVLVHGYYPKERSWFYTPAFDLRNLTRPTLEFSAIYNFQDKDQGAVFQYSIDDGKSWVVLGDYSPSFGSSGIEWFTHEDIDENPGDQASRRVGWAESSSSGAGEWELARHKLDFISEDIVRFRFALSGGADAKGEGMGIDNFWIGDRTKVVLIEEFSTELTNEARIFHETINNYLSGKGADGVPNPYASNEDAVRIAYYGFPRNNPDQIVDRLYQINPEDVNARQVYYGVFDVPTAILEGDFNRNSVGQQNNSLPPWTLAEFNRSALERPEASVVFKEIAVDQESITIHVEAALTDKGVELGIEGEHRIHVAIIEQQVSMTDTPSGQTTFKQVLRKMLPSAAGTPITFNATKDATSVTINWQVISVYLAELDPTKLELYAVAFVQNLESKRIYQAVIQRVNVRKILQLGVKDEALGTYLRVYPNPSNDRIQVDFGEEQQAGLVWQVIDNTAQQLRKGRAEKAVRTFQIDLKGLPEGVYILLLQTIDGRTSKRRIVRNND